MSTKPPAPNALTDFPGRLSPMLVKELRQGLRTNLFVIAFILLQGFMVFCLMIGAFAPGSNETNPFFWFFVYVALLIIQPIRGFGALSAEYQLKTMDLIQLTRLDAWRITLGKWTALNAQTLLLVIGILPYLVMRYFLGGVNFINDIAAVGLLALGSALGSAVTIGTSGYRSLILRIVLLIGCGIAFMILSAYVQNIFFSAWAGSSGKWADSILLLLILIYGCYFFLSIGASRIAPAAENHSLRKRLGAVIMAAVALSFQVFGVREESIVFSGIILALASIDAFCEPLPLSNPVARRFSRNAVTRFFGLIFTPGWHTGVRFFLIVSVLWSLAALYLEGDIRQVIADPFSEEVITFLSLIAMIGLPLIIIQLFFHKRTDSELHFGTYMFIQACVAVITMFLSIVAQFTGSSLSDYVYIIVPLPSVLLMGTSMENIHGPYYFIASFAIAFFSIALPMWKSRENMRELKACLKNPNLISEGPTGT